MRRLLPATLPLGASLLLLLTLAPSASAALSFRFDRASARPGATVVASEPGWPSAPVGVTVYLVPTRLPSVKPDPAGGYLLSRPPRRNVIKLGQPQLTRTHLLTIRFRVPHVSPGDYTTAFWCRAALVPRPRPPGQRLPRPPLAILGTNAVALETGAT